MQLARTSDDCALDGTVAAMQGPKYFKLIDGRALLDASDNDIECLLICHDFSGVGVHSYYNIKRSVLHV